MADRAWEEVLTEDRLWRLRVLPAAGANTRAVLFVHGFGGNAAATWKADTAKFSFPALLALDPEFADHDIFVFQYQTGFRHTPGIDAIVNQLDFAIESHLKPYTVVFVAHSMGGLVCMSYVLRKLELGAPLRIGGLLTYGTPMTGVEWVQYAQLVFGIGGITFPMLSLLSRWLSSNRQLEALRSDGAFVDSLNADWVLRVLNGGYPTIAANLRTWLPTRVVTGNDDWVVQQSSAKGFYGKLDWIPVDQGHIAMGKPAARTEEAYQIAADFLRKSAGWIGPTSAKQLRGQMDDLWKFHQSRRITEWRFDLSFAGHEVPPGQSFGLPGYQSFTVRECSYTRRLDSARLWFGFALGTIATSDLWSDDFVFLHRLLLAALTPNETQDVITTLRAVLRDPKGAWTKLFDALHVRFEHGPRGFREMIPGELVSKGDGLICPFSLPDDASGLIGKDVRVDVTFRSLLPSSMQSYHVEFPWLCEGFSTVLSVERPVTVLVASQAMRGTDQAQRTEEGHGKIKFSSDGLVIPSSSIQFEWRFAEADA